MQIEQLLDEVRRKYFTATDEIKKAVSIKLTDVINLEAELFTANINEGNSALTETVESFIDELKKEAKKTS